MVSRRALALAVALAAGCATPPPVPPPAPPGPYELPPDPVRAEAEPALSASAAAAAPPVPPAPPPRQVVRLPDPPPQDITVYRVPVGSSPTRGDAAALVTIVEFADFQCPYCARAEGPLQQIAAKYGAAVRFVWKDMPLPFHGRAEPAAELALEARAQRGSAGFWKAHDLLLAQRGHLEDADLADVAARAGLDADRAMARVQKHAYLAAIDGDVSAGEDVDATATPTFFINGRKLVGAQPFAVFEPIIDEQLAAARAAVAGGVPAAKLYETLQKGAKLAPLDLAKVAAPTPASPSRGPQNARVVVQIWSDLECPFCKRVEPTLTALEAAFPGQIRIVWHNHPLSLHLHAEKAAEAALEAFAQRGAAGFWKMHDLILANQDGDGLERAALERYAAAVGLDVARFRASLDGGVHRAAIDADGAAAMAAGLNATPGFSINGYRVNGAMPLGYFKKVVRRALSDAK
jgi:protein-disulfide isomerase